MTKQLFRLVLAGILAGFALFIMPYLIIRTVIFFLLIGAIFRLVGAGRWRRGGLGYGIYPHKRYAFAGHWQNMNSGKQKSFNDNMETETFNRQNDRSIDIM